MPKGDREILKADPEDGTTPIANLLLEAVAMAKLSGLEKGAILYLWRQTYGWQEGERRRKQRIISLAEWVRALNSQKSRVSFTLKSLTEKNIFSRSPLGTGKGYIYTMNTRISEWDHSCINLELLSNPVTVNQNDNSLPNSEQLSKPITEQLSKPTTEQLSKPITPLATNSPPSPTPPTPVKEILNKYKERDRYIDIEKGNNQKDDLEILPGQSRERCIALARGELETTALLKKRAQDELKKRGIEWRLSKI